MIKPPSLKKGDKIGIVAPAKWIPQDKYPPIIQLIESKGYKVIRGDTTYKEFGPFAGTDKERITDLQQMLEDKDIKAVFCLRGGYGVVRIIDKLNIDTLKKHPKWVVGFSDITILHNFLSNSNIESIHGQMPVNFNSNHSGINQLFDTIEGKLLNYTFEPTGLNRPGCSKGILTGGNLAILCSLLATPYDVSFDNKILFIEEIGEYLYRLDRMMHQLKLAGKLKNIAGLVVGGLSSMEDNIPAFGQTAEEIIFSAVKDYNYPVCFGFPAGHIPNNQPLIMGRNVQLNVGVDNCELIFEKS